MTRRCRRRWVRLLLGAVGVCVVAGAAAAAYAAIPAAGTQLISGCYDKTGALRVIDKEAGAACTKNERELIWNQQGPRGLTGEKGDTGVGVQLEQLGSGEDPSCPTGGTKFTVGATTSYTCNGENGPLHRGSWTVPAYTSPAEQGVEVHLYGSPLGSGAAGGKPAATELVMAAGQHIHNLVFTLRHETPIPQNAFLDGELVAGPEERLITACLWTSTRDETCSFPDLELPVAGPVMFRFVFWANELWGSPVTLPASTMLYSWSDTAG